MPRPIPMTDVQKLKASLGKENEDLLIRLLLRLGVRTCELYTISLKSLDPVNRTITVKAAKGSKDRPIDLGELYNPLEWALKSAEHISCLASPTGGKLSREGFTASLRRYWGKLRFRVLGEYAKVYGLHSLRATAAQNLYIETSDIIVVQNFLGHKSMNSTYSYVQSIQAKGLGKILL